MMIYLVFLLLSIAAFFQSNSLNPNCTVGFYLNLSKEPYAYYNGINFPLVYYFENATDITMKCESNCPILLVYSEDAYEVPDVRSSRYFRYYNETFRNYKYEAELILQGNSKVTGNYSCKVVDNNPSILKSMFILMNGEFGPNILTKGHRSKTPTVKSYFKWVTGVPDDNDWISIPCISTNPDSKVVLHGIEHSHELANSIFEDNRMDDKDRKYFKLLDNSESVIYIPLLGFKVNIHSGENEFTFYKCSLENNMSIFGYLGSKFMEDSTIALLDQESQKREYFRTDYIMENEPIELTFRYNESIKFKWSDVNLSDFQIDSIIFPNSYYKHQIFFKTRMSKVEMLAIECFSNSSSKLLFAWIYKIQKYKRSPYGSLSTNSKNELVCTSGKATYLFYCENRVECKVHTFEQGALEFARYPLRRCYYVIEDTDKVYPEIGCGNENKKLTNTIGLATCEPNRRWNILKPERSFQIFVVATSGHTVPIENLGKVSTENFTRITYTHKNYVLNVTCHVPSALFARGVKMVLKGKDTKSLNTFNESNSYDSQEVEETAGIRKITVSIENIDIEQLDYFSCSSPFIENEEWEIIQSSFSNLKPQVSKESSPFSEDFFFAGIIIMIFIITSVIGFVIIGYFKYKNSVNLWFRAYLQGNSEKLEQAYSTKSSLNSLSHLIPYDVEKYRISEDNLEVGEKELGSGAYGRVVEGILRQNGSDEETLVAVKMQNVIFNELKIKAILSELKIMTFIGYHENIVRVIGACVNMDAIEDLKIVLELCTNGSLLKFLEENKPYSLCVKLSSSAEAHYHQLMTMETLPNELPLNPIPTYQNGPVLQERLNFKSFIKWAKEVASGMEFLASKKVVHSDLACRNILLDDNLIAKISDFGLSRNIRGRSIYQKKSKEEIPWMWMSIEALTDYKFSTKSDVWSYGVTLWEIFSLGETPYHGKEYNEDFIKELIKGERLDKPKLKLEESCEITMDKIYNEMLECMIARPECRPTFKQLYDFFAELELEF